MIAIGFKEWVLLGEGVGLFSFRNVNGIPNEICAGFIQQPAATATCRLRRAVLRCVGWRNRSDAKLGK